MIRQPLGVTRRGLGYLLVATASYLLGGVPVRAVTGPTFVVNSNGDDPDANPTDGICLTAFSECTLRAAIMSANHTPGGGATVDLRFVPGGLIRLTSVPSGANDETTGDLNLQASMSIVGAGASTTIIDGNKPTRIDRVFEVNPIAPITVSISGVTIRNGKPANLAGGAVNVDFVGTYANSLSSVTLSNCVVTNNDFIGIWSYAGPITLIYTTVTGNSSGGLGSSGAMTLINSTISNNTNTGGGGGVYVGGGTGIPTGLTAINSTISGNTATTGGGVYVPGGNPPIALFNTTITNNRATTVGRGGGVFSPTTPSAITLTNSIVAGNFEGSGSADGDCAASVTVPAGGVLLLGASAGCTPTVLGSLIVGAAKLGPLQSNGGPNHTQTHAPLAGSPAIDTGPVNGCLGPSAALLRTDQRGYPRPLPGTGPCDLGAYEVGVRDQHDFNGNGQADILWHNPSTTENGLWFMNGFTIQSPQAFPGAPPGFQIVGTGDFDGDGHADILWRRAATGEDGIWLMNGASIVAALVLPPVSTNWQIAGVGDFNGDGFADIVWQDAGTGQAGIWEMNGVVLLASALISGPTPGWQIVSVGDFNADGMDDLVWRNSTTGQAGLWLMNGLSPATAQLISGPNPNWVIAATGDFNGDGKADILWRNPTTGENGMWLMNGVAVLSGLAIPGAGAAWQVVGTHDFNGDVRADILWRNSVTGENGMWQMNGFTIQAAQAIPGVAPAWEIH